MKNMKRLLACVTALVMALALFTGCGGGTQSAPPASNPPAASTPEEKPNQNENAADLVLTRGTIQTMVSEDDVAEAVAVKDGVIVYVGDSAGAEAWIGADTNVIDLAGRYVTPGFIDSHNHYPGPYLTMETELDLMALGADLDAYKKALTEFVAAHPDFDIYLVTSMDLKAFPDSKPSNDWLDEICSDKPIKVIDVSTHGWLLNSKAIEMVGLTKDTPDPAGGTIYKDANGELTGYFSDCDDIITGLPSFEYTAEQYKEAFRAFQAEANSYGITSLNAGGDLDGLKDIQLEVAVEMEKDGELYLRINNNFFTYPPLDAQDVISYLDANQGANSEFINVRQVKFTLDGVPEGKSSYLLEPYAETAGTDPDYVSSPAVDQETLDAFVTAVNAAGYTVQIHCMGDASVREALNSFAASAEANGNPDVRNAITHVNLITDEDKVRMGELGVIAHMQPMWFYYDPFFSPLEEQMFGPERFDSEYHIKDMLDAGIIITGSLDYPVTYDFAPLLGIEAGATQCSPYPGEDQDVETYTRNADQAVSVYEMLKMYTSDGAYGAFLDDRVGTIEVGKKADLVVLGDNLLTCDVKHISDVEVVYTISDGRIVYENA